MDEIQDEVDGIEEEASVVKDLYDLVDMYQVPVNPEDMAVYQVCIPLPLTYVATHIMLSHSYTLVYRGRSLLYYCSLPRSRFLTSQFST